MIFLIPFPSQKMTFYDWATSFPDSSPGITLPPVPRETSKWRNWAYSLIRSNAASVNASVPVPLKSVYPKDEDWRKWAIQVIQSVQ
jgi:hypothetical protein